MAEESLGKPVTRLSFWYLDSGKIWTVDFTAERRRNSLSELMVAVDTMEQVSAFPENIGPHCSYCPYLYACAERDEIARRREAEGW